MKLTNEQIDILKEIKVDWNKIYLQWQLDRKQYININQVLETIWAKWNKKEKVHIAEWLTNEDLINALSEIYETWEVETLKDIVKKYQFYPTPKEVVEYLVELAEIKENDEVIEPSAWDGAILKVILEKYPVGFIKIYANEIYRDRYLELLKILDKVSQDDFLNFNNMYFDKFIMNPPFAKSQDVKHILKAYELLKDWWRIVSVASSSIQYREGQLYEELRALNPEFIELPEWSFKESWTMVNSIIVVINK
jgi:hypothetical protein